MTLRAIPTFAVCVWVAHQQCSAVAQDAPGWGGIKGRFVLEGEPPVGPNKVEQGDKSVRNPECCAAQVIPDDTLRINPENKGIADIFVYLKSAPSRIHPDLVKSTCEKVSSMINHCRIEPYAMIVRTDQTIEVQSNDPILHSLQAYTINQSSKVIMTTLDGHPAVQVDRELNATPTPIPIPVGCNIHSHMEARWLVVDHPYAVLSNERGEFVIDKLPEGTHSFRLWHNRAGWLFHRQGNRTLEVVVRAGETTDLGTIKVPPDNLPAVKSAPIERE
jgi:hypothetical protein